ncbi:serum amyloid P-component-like [Otolemur garnettii]|uniref:Pentraxin family member n=1 Tax=Otolemur garnettii TaxID=30611 RepID=H0Y274_OTOGA|nr:serum amyloid P-component-like [Otolemur garnettii]
MNQLLLWVSVLTSLLEAFAATDMSGKVFIFPKESNSAHVSLITHLEKPLQNFTVCLRAYTDLSRSYSLFSYSIQTKSNEIVIYKPRIGEYHFIIGGDIVFFRVSELFPEPVHICASWESSSGIAELWVNGKPLVRKGLRQGYSLGAHPKIVLGQEQDSYGGRFDKSQSFVGEIGDLYMWDSVLSPQDIQLVYTGSYIKPNILDWQALNYKTQGYVVTKPQRWS